MSLFYYSASAAVAAASPIRLPCPTPTAIPGPTGVLSPAGVHLMQSPAGAAGIQWIPAGLCGSTQLHYMFQPCRTTPVDKNITTITGLRVPLLTRINRSVRCAECNITLNSPHQARQHYNGKSHQRRLQKLQQLQKQQQDNDSAQQTVTSSTVDETSNCSSVDDNGTENNRKRHSSETSSGSPPPTKCQCSDDVSNKDVTTNEMLNRVDDIKRVCETDVTSSKCSEALQNKTDNRQPDVIHTNNAENDVINERTDRSHSVISSAASLVRPATCNGLTSSSFVLPVSAGTTVRYHSPIYGIIRPPTVAPSVPAAVIESYQLNVMNQFGSAGTCLKQGALGPETILPALPLPVGLPFIRDFTNGPATSAVSFIPSFNDVASVRLGNFPPGSVCSVPCSSGLPVHGIVDMSVVAEFSSSGQQTTISRNVNMTPQTCLTTNQNSPISTTEIVDQSKPSRIESNNADWMGNVQSALRFGDTWNKMDPVSKAVYENFLGKLTGPKSSKQWKPHQRYNGAPVQATKR